MAVGDQITNFWATTEGSSADTLSQPAADVCHCHQNTLCLCHRWATGSTWLDSSPTSRTWCHMHSVPLANAWLLVIKLLALLNWIGNYQSPETVTRNTLCWWSKIGRW
jgi:hypothetical protein